MDYERVMRELSYKRRKAKGGVEVHRAAEIGSPAMFVAGESIISGMPPTGILRLRWNRNR